MILNISWQPETVETWSIDIFMWPFKLCQAMYCVSTMSGLFTSPGCIQTWSIDIFMWPFKLCHAMYCVSIGSGLFTSPGCIQT